jgi:CRP-like cAMP-binding protein
MGYDYFTAGTTIFECGDSGDQFFIILKGAVSV